MIRVKGTTYYLKIPKKNANPRWNFRTAAGAYLSYTQPDLPRVYGYNTLVKSIPRPNSTPIEIDRQKLFCFCSDCNRSLNFFKNILPVLVQ